MKDYYVYMMTNKNHKVLYIGVTNNLEKRIYEYKNKLIEGFTKRYNCTKLVWYTSTNNIESEQYNKKNE